MEASRTRGTGPKGTAPRAPAPRPGSKAYSRRGGGKGRAPPPMAGGAAGASGGGAGGEGGGGGGRGRWCGERWEDAGAEVGFPGDDDDGGGGGEVGARGVGLEAALGEEGAGGVAQGDAEALAVAVEGGAVGPGGAGAAREEGGEA